MSGYRGRNTAGMSRYRGTITAEIFGGSIGRNTAGMCGYRGWNTAGMSKYRGTNIADCPGLEVGYCRNVLVQR